MKGFKDSDKWPNNVVLINVSSFENQIQPTLIQFYNLVKCESLSLQQSWD